MGFIGLTLFVAVPLPGTGVWTGGALAAYLLGIEKGQTIPALILGGVLSMGGITVLPALGGVFGGGMG